MLWRLHQVHHTDLDVDVTTGVRFHPVEIILSALYKAAIVALLGIDPWVVVLFEAVLNASAVYTHGNIRIPERLDAILRWAFCTPDMHRVHHSTVPEETNSNFGFFLSVWDRGCGTLRQAPAKGQHGVELGLAEHRDPARLGFSDIALMPFRTIERAYPAAWRRRGTRGIGRAECHSPACLGLAAPVRSAHANGHAYHEIPLGRPGRRDRACARLDAAASRPYRRSPGPLKERPAVELTPMLLASHNPCMNA